MERHVLHLAHIVLAVLASNRYAHDFICPFLAKRVRMMVVA